MNVTMPDTTEQKIKEVKFSIPEDWITSETRMMQRIDHLQSTMVELYRMCMMIITETELLREGIEQVSKTVPTYRVLSETEMEEEKPEFIEDLEREEQEIQEEEPKDETNNRMSSRGL
jgi:hypothetical protein